MPHQYLGDSWVLAVLAVVSGGPGGQPLAGLLGVSISSRARLPVLDGPLLRGLSWCGVRTVGPF
jgi:hypothetical protein